MSGNLRTRRTVRHSRALGIALTPKAEKYMERRPYGPGQHGRARRKQDSDYAVRLKEKQRLRAQYNIREKQMHRAYVEAKRREVEAILGPACRASDILYSTRILKKTGLRLAD